MNEAEELEKKNAMDFAIERYPFKYDSLLGPVENETAMYKAKAKQLVFVAGYELATAQQAERVKELEEENEKLKRYLAIVAQKTLTFLQQVDNNALTKSK